MNENNPKEVSSVMGGASEFNPGPRKSWLSALKGIHKGNIVAILGVLVAVLVPAWQIYFVERSHIAVEISTIQKANIGGIKVDFKKEGLNDLEEFIPEYLKYIYHSDGRREKKVFLTFTIAELRDILEHAVLLQQDVPQRLKKLKSTIEDIEALLGIGIGSAEVFVSPETVEENSEKLKKVLQNAQFDRFKNLSIRQYRSWELPNYLDPFLVKFYSRRLLEYTVAGATPGQEEIDMVVGTLGSLLKNLKAAQIKLEEQDAQPVDLRKMKQIITEILERILQRNVQFKVTTSVSNSGRVSTSNELPRGKPARYQFKYF